jgi:cyclopropane fatty-acyl-phospholipid synthase-like methyltransferase
VDITGFPHDLAQQIGYKRAIAYDPPDYDFVLETKVDLVTCINLNAHIPFDSLERILRNALACLKDDGALVLIAELDNAGLSYSRFNDTRKKNALVNGMEHYYFENKASFLAKLGSSFPDLTLVEERSLAAITTLNQHYIYQTGKEPTSLTRGLILVGDMLAGPINSLYTRIRPRCEAFLVAFVFQKGGA